MNSKNAIGLDKDQARHLSDKLNELLSNYSIFTKILVDITGTLKEKKFFELHIKFEELYNDLILKIDEVAERILTLGHVPKHNYADYRANSKIKESVHVSDGIIAVEDILTSFQTIIILQRELLTISSDAGDEGTNALMSDYIRSQEKLVWMYSSFLDK